MARGETYEEFIEKFKDKHTTDDCYTPPIVYEAVKEWAINHYKWQGRQILRPFYKGGDYENFEYPNGAVVLDNPPFSIISQIAKFYEERGITYFLFAPSLTIGSILAATSHICTGVRITYENGAEVNTSFICSEGAAFMSAPSLYKAVNEANKKNREGFKKHQTLYRYPKNILKHNDFEKMSRLGVDFSTDTCEIVKYLYTKEGKRVKVFGNGIAISPTTAEEVRNELEAAQERGTEKEEQEATALYFPHEIKATGGLFAKVERG